MIRHLNRIWALCMALVLALGCCAAVAEENTENPVLVTMDGEEYRLETIKDVLDQLVSAGYAAEDDYELAIEYFVQDKTVQSKITEWGLDQFTEEELEAFRNEAHSEWESALDSYVSYFLTEDTDEARAQVREEGVAYFSEFGYSEEAFEENLKVNATYDKLEKKILEGKDTAVSEEAIRAEFEATAAQHQAAVEGNVALYELYKAYYGMEFWFTPEGYRSIIHILMKVDDALLTAYTEAQAAYEESKSEENPDGDAELKAAMETAQAAVLASKQAEIDDIYARLEKGESFVDLIAQYGEDTGMADPATLAEGYLVHKDSVIYDAAFTAAAFSEKMQKPGDFSDPVIGSYGIHILYYQKDIPGGTIDLSSEISEEIQESLYTEKVNSFYKEALEAWKAEHKIVYNQEAIDALTAAPETAAE